MGAFVGAAGVAFGIGAALAGVAGVAATAVEAVVAGAGVEGVAAAAAAAALADDLWRVEAPPDGEEPPKRFPVKIDRIGQTIKV
jgi:hypothetical protein